MDISALSNGSVYVRKTVEENVWKLHDELILIVTAYWKLQNTLMFWETECSTLF